MRALAAKVPMASSRSLPPADQLGHAIDADIRLHAEVPLFTLLRLAHLRVALAILVSVRGWEPYGGRRTRGMVLDSIVT